VRKKERKKEERVDTTWRIDVGDIETTEWRAGRETRLQSDQATTDKECE